MRLFKKIIVSAELELLTGLHIGDNKENVEIGGVDSPVVRRKDNNQPYIPGNSLKGKMRALVEIATGANAKSKFDYYPGDSARIAELFGSTGDNGLPSRIIARDAYLKQASVNLLRDSDYTDMPYTEVKWENVINRVRGVADNPRQQERVPAGAKFDVEFIINIVADTQLSAEKLEQQHITLLNSGLRLLENDYLGGSGSRGYGQVRFAKIKRTDVTISEELNFNYANTSDISLAD
jgi:CRISPR-associated protein Csm3